MSPMNFKAAVQGIFGDAKQKDSAQRMELVREIGLTFRLAARKNVDCQQVTRAMMIFPIE